MRLSDTVRLIVLSAIWGASFLFMRIIAPVLGALPTAFFRVVFGATGLLLILALMRTKWDFKGKIGAAMALGVINSGIPFAMYSFAAKILPAGYSAIFNATTPLMGVIVGTLFFSEKLSQAKFVGVLLGLIGVVVLTKAGPVELTTEVMMGAGACLIATACYGVASFMTRRWISEKGGLDSKLLAFASQLGAAVFIMPFFIASISSTIGQPLTNWGGTGLWLAMAGLGLVCTAFAYILYFRLIADIGPMKSLTVTFLIPPFGILWGAIFLGEQITWGHIAGGTLIGLAVWAVLKPAVQTKKSVAA